MAVIRYDILFRGRVQGVFFRATACDLAKTLPLNGWIRNEPDGSVRCVIEGEPDTLDRFLSSLKQAKQNNIDSTDITHHPSTSEFRGFDIRY